MKILPRILKKWVREEDDECVRWRIDEEEEEEDLLIEGTKKFVRSGEEELATVCALHIFGNREFYN